MEEQWDAFFAEVGSDPVPSLYRIYKSTVQRVAPLVTSLNSHACFLLTVQNCRKIAAWSGRNVAKADITTMNELAQEILLRDYGDKSVPDFPIMEEGLESLDILEKFLDIIWALPTVYQSRLAMAERRSITHNNAVSIGTLNPTRGEQFDLEETAFAHPDGNGVVPRVTFPNVEMASIVFVTVGDQWDLWFARGVPAEQRTKAAAFVDSLVETQIVNSVEDPSSINRDALKHYIATVEQGEETVVFKRPIKIFTDFEPLGRTVPRAPLQRGPLAPTDAAPSPRDSGSSDNLQALVSGSGAPGARPPPLVFDADIDVVDVDDSEFDRTDFWRGDRIDLMTQRLRPPPPARLDPDTGVFSITANMLQVVDHENIGVERRRLLLEEASANPAALVGWQVEIDEGLFRGVFVVVGFRKSLIRRKTYFHLAALQGDEFWLRLKRSERKLGVRFRPLRQVAILQ